MHKSTQKEDSKKYYRLPNIVIEQPGDYTYAFTMRLLNSLSTLGIKVWDDRLYNYRLALKVHSFAILMGKTHPDTIPSHE